MKTRKRLQASLDHLLGELKDTEEHIQYFDVTFHPKSFEKCGLSISNLEAKKDRLLKQIAIFREQIENIDKHHYCYFEHEEKYYDIGSYECFEAENDSDWVAHNMLALVLENDQWIWVKHCPICGYTKENK